MKLRLQRISACEDLDGFSAFTADMLVEVDTGTESEGSLLARRGEPEEKPNAARILLLLARLITKTIGSPVTTFTQMVRHAADAVSIALTPRMVDETIVANVHCSRKGRHGLHDHAGLHQLAGHADWRKHGYGIHKRQSTGDQRDHAVRRRPGAVQW